MAHVSQSLSTELDKLEFGEPQASGIQSPAYWRGGKFNSLGLRRDRYALGSIGKCRPDGLRIPRAFSPPNSNLSVTTNTDNTSIFNCRSNKDWVILSCAVANAADCVADNLLVVQLRLGSNFSGKHNLITLYQSFTANTAFRILCLASIEDGVRDSVCNFVRMAAAH